MGKVLCELVSAMILDRRRRQRYRNRHREDLHPELRLSRLVLAAQAVRAVHERAFLKYKGCFGGRDVVVVACGPTAAKYKPIPGAVHIGVNSAYRLENVGLDFLFAQDCAADIRRRRKEIVEYSGNACKKFFGIIGEDVCGEGNCTWPESDAIAAGAERYYVREGVPGEPGLIPRDISCNPLTDYQNIVFPALQFALWTNPARICLVGCDCTNSGYFDSSKRNWLDFDAIFAGYRDIKAFAEKWYPDTKIVSVNPVGLKGFFEEA